MLNKLKELTKEGYSIYIPSQMSFTGFSIYLYDCKREIGEHTEISDEELAATILDPELYICEELDRLKEEIKKSEDTVRNGPGDTIKKELVDILHGKYPQPHVSIWW